MGRIVINKTENGQTVILNDTSQEVSGGYFDKEMEWHEFGGGKTFVNPEVHMTAIRGENVDSSIEIPITTGFYSENGYLTDSTCYLPEDENEVEINFYATSSETPNEFYIYSSLKGYHYEFNVTNTENCSFSDVGKITVSDISEPCSLTITYTAALPL